jgi:hypothetical protein
MLCDLVAHSPIEMCSLCVTTPFGKRSFFSSRDTVARMPISMAAGNTTVGSTPFSFPPRLGSPPSWRSAGRRMPRLTSGDQIKPPRGLEVPDMARSIWVYRKLRNFRAGIESRDFLPETRLWSGPLNLERAGAFPGLCLVVGGRPQLGAGDSPPAHVTRTPLYSSSAPKARRG